MTAAAPNLCEWCCHPATPGGFAPLVAIHGWPDTIGMVYLDEHHRPPDDAVRLVPEHPGVAARSSDIVGISTARTARARQDKTGRLTLAEHIAQRIDWTPTCLPGTERATIVRQILDLDDDAADFDRAEGVAALLRRCDEEDALAPSWDSAAVSTAIIRALLGGEH